MLNQQTKSRRYVLSIGYVLIALLLCVPSFAFAQGSNPVLDFAAWAGDGIAGALGTIVYPLAHTLGIVIVGIGGFALNMAIHYLIIGWGAFLTGPFGQHISQIWTIIRDLFNLFFIFSFIFLGIKTILNSEDSGTRRAIGHLIIAALFINFSLFIALAVIDFSNIVATQIYNQLIYTGIANSEGGNAGGDITGAFMEVASIGSFFASESANVQGSNLLFYAIFMLIFFIVTGIIFLFATYHVIYRFVVLNLCLIFSPVLFAGLILPNFKKFSDQWLQSLLRNSFFAPAFLFLLYVSLQVLSTLKGTFAGNEGVGFTTILEGKEMTADGFSIFLLFGLAIGFLYASVKVGDMMGVAGSKTIVGGLNAAGKGVKSFAFKGAYMPVGWGLNKFGVGGVDKLNQLAESEKGTPGRKRAIMTRMLMGGRSGSEAVRGGLEKASNIGGRDARIKADKAVTQRATRDNAIGSIVDNLKTGDRGKQERAIADASSAQLLEMVKSSTDKKLILDNAGKLSKSQYEAIIKSDDVTDEFRGTLSKNRAEQIVQRLIEDNKKSTLGEVIGKADTSELEAIGFEKAKAVAGKLSAKQIDDWKDLTPTEKSQLKAARKDQLEVEFGKDNTGKIDGSNSKDLFDRITSDEERSKLPDSILVHTEAAPFLNTNVLTKIVDNNGITDVHRAEIKKNILAYWKVTDMNKYNTMEEWFDRNNVGQRY